MTLVYSIRKRKKKKKRMWWRSTVHKCINNLNKNLSINHDVSLSSLSVTTYLDFFFFFPANHNWNHQKKNWRRKNKNGNEIPVILFYFFFILFSQFNSENSPCPHPGTCVLCPGSQQQFLTGNWKPSICYISCCSCCVCIIGKRSSSSLGKCFL